VAQALALTAAFLFALAATLQQKGALGIGDVTLASPRSLVLLARQRIWLLGTAALLVGYALQAAALDRGRLAVIQPLLVMTVVFALPLGYWLTGQSVGRREVLGATAIVVGLALFTVFGNPAGGQDNAPANEWAKAMVVFGSVSVVLVALGGRGSLKRKAAMYGAAAGILFGLSAGLAKPTVETLHVGIAAVLSSWEFYAMAITGIVAFVIQQVSLGTGKLAASVATVSVANPVVGIVIGTLVLDERLARPAWHVVVGVTGLLLALAGAVVITLASEGGGEVRRPDARAQGPEAAASAPEGGTATS
jgi:drug/metabolite transporter (DMT)-like permease